MLSLCWCFSWDVSQVFSYTADKEIRTDDLCLDVSRLNGPVVMLKCHHMKGNQMFEYDAEVGTAAKAEKNQDHGVGSRWQISWHWHWGSALCLCHEGTPVCWVQSAVLQHTHTHTMAHRTHDCCHQMVLYVNLLAAVSHSSPVVSHSMSANGNMILRFMRVKKLTHRLSVVNLVIPCDTVWTAKWKSLPDFWCMRFKKQYL